MTEIVLKELVPPTTEVMLKKEFSCPKCQNPISPPIYHCDKGHSFCNMCYKTGDDCILCGSKCSGGRTHHLERIVELYTYRCKYFSSGCRKICKIERLRAHEEECQTFEMHCPFMFDSECAHIGSIQQTVFHCQLVHTDRTYVGKGPMRFVITKTFIDSIVEIQAKLSLLKRKKKKIFMSFYMLYIEETIFQVVCQFELEHIKVAMYRISLPSDVEDKYEFVLFLHNDNEISAAVITNECATIGEKPHNPLFDNTFVNVDIGILTLCSYCTVHIVAKN